MAGHLVRRLQEFGVDTLFGVPGATCDAAMLAAQDAGMTVVVNSSDLEAGYAADGYARMRGLSAVAVSYGVGTLGLSSVVAGALAERNPMVLINGGPSQKDLDLQAEHQALYSHSSSRTNSDLAVFTELCGHAVRLSDAASAAVRIDEAIAHARQHHEPVYVEIDKTLWYAGAGRAKPPPGRTGSALSVDLAPFRQASKPLVVVGVGVARWGLSDAVGAWLEATGLPWVSTLTGKAAVSEQGRGFSGVYLGRRTLPPVKSLVESADSVLALGVITGRQLRDLALHPGLVRVPFDQLHAVPAALAAMRGEATPIGSTFAERRRVLGGLGPDPAARGEVGLSYDDAMAAVSDRLTEDHLVVTDTSLSMYPAAELTIQGAGGFVANGVWQAIGFSVGAAVGLAEAQTRRVIAVCGDGGFQMTAMSLSTMARYRHKTVVVVLDNGRYGIEQFLLNRGWFSGGEGVRDYLTLNRWKYAQLAQALGIAQASVVATRSELEAALDAALESDGPSLISVVLQPHDVPDELRL